MRISDWSSDVCSSDLLGYDAGINHRTSPDLKAAIAEACPDGVDVYFENTAGPIYDAVMANLALRARIVVVGMISLYGRFHEPDIGLRHHRQHLHNRARMEGFLVSDLADRFPEGLA